MLRLVGLVAMATLALACSSESGEADDDGATGGAAGGAAGGNAGGNAGGGGQSTGGTGGGSSGELPNSCDDACQTLSAVIDFGNGQRIIERAFYGLTVSSGASTIYVELSRGGGESCPTMSSPTPERLVLLHDVPIPVTTTEVTETDGITAQYFDFVGDDLPTSVQTPGTSITVTPRAIDVCVDCFGEPPPSDADGFFAFDVNVAFDGGTAAGSVYATHCDSLDTTQ